MLLRSKLTLKSKKKSNDNKQPQTNQFKPSSNTTLVTKVDPSVQLIVSEFDGVSPKFYQHKCYVMLSHDIIYHYVEVWSWSVKESYLVMILCNTDWRIVILTH